ncbi:MAG: hypothetical protein WA433_03235, partial [Desulfobaccales bacterium]
MKDIYHTFFHMGAIKIGQFANGQSWAGGCPRRSSPVPLDFLDQSRDDLKKIAHQAHIRHL